MIGPLEATALAILLACAVVLVLLGVWWDVQDRKPLDPPEPVITHHEHKPRHAAWGETTRLRPPD